MIDNAARGVFWLKDRKDIRADTLWDAAKRAGKTVAIVTWPSTYGADASWLVPEDLAPRTNPQEDIRKGSTPGLFDALSQAVGTPTLVHYGQADSGTPLDRMTGTFAAEVVRRHKPDLLLAHFLDYDHRMHFAPFTTDDSCNALARVDGWIAHILEAYEQAGLRDRTTVFVVSDHGFLKVEQGINLGALLREAGWSDVLGEAGLEDVFDVRIAGGSVALYPLEPRPAAWVERVRAQFRPRLEQAHGTQLRWITDAEARAFGGFPGRGDRALREAGILVSHPAGGGSCRAGRPGPIPRRARLLSRRARHGCLFVASGSGVKDAGDIGRLRMRDVGATIAAVAGVKLKDATGADESARFRSRP
jgi:hypothetical protein